MEGQVLGGGVVILVAALLWLAYLLPSWYSKHQYNATERNAVRLSQALRILAETSEEPEAVRVELDTRSAHRQSKLARRAQAERQRLEEAAAEAEAERIREEAEYAKEQLRTSALEARDQRKAEIVAERQLQRARSEAERARVAADAAAEHERLRAELHVARTAPAVVARKQARARRNVRLIALGLVLAGLAMLVWGIVATGVLAAVGGVLVSLLGVVVLRRMAAVSRRSVRVEPEVVVAEAPRKRVSVLHDEPAPKWTPRTLPAPMTSVAGSLAASAQDAVDAREALRLAALEEAAREKAAALAPVALHAAMPDADIEAHVRQLLASRAS